METDNDNQEWLHEATEIKFSKLSGNDEKRRITWYKHYESTEEKYLESTKYSINAEYEEYKVFCKTR